MPSRRAPGSYNESVHDLIIHGRAICIRGVNYHFGTGESRSQVLFDNRLDIGKGEVVIMTGPSGSGKTTLLTLIGGLRSAQAGSILVNGRELVGASRPALVAHRRQIGFIFQHHNLFSSLSAIENVRMATALKTGGRTALRRAPTRSSSGSGSATGVVTTPGGSRAGSASAWRSPGPWSTALSSCSPTSRRPPSTPSRAPS